MMLPFIGLRGYAEPPCQFNFIHETLRNFRVNFFDTTGVAKFTRSEERGRGFVLRNFNRLNCTLAVLVSALKIDSLLLVPSLK